MLQGHVTQLQLYCTMTYMTELPVVAIKDLVLVMAGVYPRCNPTNWHVNTHQAHINEAWIAALQVPVAGITPRDPPCTCM